MKEYDELKSELSDIDSLDKRIDLDQHKFKKIDQDLL